MAEVKRMFVGAKMDKDSDERFVANGDYIDAVNVDIIHSEGNDAGVVRNKKGNTLTVAVGYTNGKGIGIFKDNSTDCIYFFITSTEVNAILEWDEANNALNPILVDAGSVLGWDSNTLITGIQIIEGTLGWVVEDKEPCAIDIRTFRDASTDELTTTQYNGGNFTLADITMLRVPPLTAPSMALSSTLRDGILETTTLKNFTLAQLNDGSLSAPANVGASVVFNIPSGSDYIIGDKIKLTSDSSSSDSVTIRYEINVVVTGVSVGGSTIVATIISRSDLVEDNVLAWEVNLIQAKPLYELVFPRFAYRWKYKNNQYSTFSPFTQVAFLPDEFQYNSQKGFNTGMTNNVRKVTLSGFDTPPADVVEVDILYKESNSTAVYVVETIDPSDSSYVITDELIHNLVDETQLVRPWDACPKSALALESVGNRFVLGNYKKGYDLGTDIKFESAIIESADIAEVGTPTASVKSLRTYQGGVVFKDLLGRETPVFSHKSGVVKTTLEDASTANTIKFKMLGTPPDFATHFKYFIKDTSNEYYNLAADRLYQTEDKLATWISFPSSERNKVSIDSYLIAKKTHDQDFPVTDTENKFKIIDIQNEVPTEISTQKEVVAESTIYFDSNFGDGNGQTKRNAGSTPIPNSKVFLIATDSDTPSKGISSVLLEKLVKGNWIRFNVGNSSNSKYYKISSVVLSKQSDTYYELNSTSDIFAKVYVSEPFGEDINFLYVNPSQSDSDLVNTQVSMKVFEEQELANQEQFTGRFFVKLASNPVLNEVFAQDAAYVTLNAANVYNGGYINGDVNFKIHAGGSYPRLGYSVANTSGGLNIARNPSWADDDVNDTIYDIVFEKRHRTPIDNAFIAAINTVGTKIRFSNHPTIYTVVQSRAQFVDYKDNDYTRYWTLFDKRLTADVSPYLTGSDIVVEIVGVEENAAFTSTNPAIFETEPAEGTDLNIYYEASDAIPIAQYNTEQTLDYFNCYAFGNGVESNRIRDDFNAPYIDKGAKVSAVLDEPYGEEHVPNEMIWSGIFNSNSGVNNLNQFLAAEKITKQVNPIYGSIQFLLARDTDMVVYCEDKILQILADKDALYNADGSINVTASNAVLGDARPFIGEFGISTDRGSVASYGFRAYNTDSKRGVVIRLSRDGITPIVRGYENELEDEFKTATSIIGSYDDETGTYNVTMNGKTHQFSEASGGWTSTWEIEPEAGITLNNTYYTVKNGKLYKHNDEVNRNTWYGNAAVDSTITIVFNDEPSMVKKFLTLAYEGDDGWYAPAIETNKQSGEVNDWIEKEGVFYNHIKGIPLTWTNSSQNGNLDTKEFAVQGLGNLVSIAGDTATTEFTINVFDDPADH